MENIIYRYDEPIVEGIFLSRPNRFIAHVLVDGEECIAHVKNTGRLRELLQTGKRCWLQVSSNTKRKTKYDLISVEYKGEIVNVDSQIPNKVVFDAFSKGGIEGWEGADLIKKEVNVGKSRLDLRVDRKGQSLFVEVKGVNLVFEGGHAAFPDAKTERGTRHLLELLEIKKQGYEAMVIFLIQRPDAVDFRPHKEIDPLFDENFYKVVREGVHARAYRSIVGPDYIGLGERIGILGLL